MDSRLCGNSLGKSALVDFRGNDFTDADAVIPAEAGIQ